MCVYIYVCVCARVYRVRVCVCVFVLTSPANVASDAPADCTFIL